MKYTSVALVFLSAISTASAVKAESQTVTLGYAQSKVQDFKNIRGLNLKYRYEWDSPLSLITSFTYMSGSEDKSYLVTQDIIDRHTEVKYYSLAVGPAYRFSQYLSAYGLIGANKSKIDYNYNWKNYGGDSYTDMGNIKGGKDSTNLMYGVGLQINTLSNVTVDIAYEGTNISDGSKNHAINGFTLGLGYKF